MERFLVCYDYGTGGLWDIVLADSADQIRKLYPEVIVFEEPPAWMEPEDLAKIEAQEPIGLEGKPEGLFKSVWADKRRGRIS